MASPDLTPEDVQRQLDDLPKMSEPERANSGAVDVLSPLGQPLAMRTPPGNDEIPKRPYDKASDASFDRPIERT